MSDWAGTPDESEWTMTGWPRHHCRKRTVHSPHIVRLEGYLYLCTGIRMKTEQETTNANDRT